MKSTQPLATIWDMDGTILDTERLAMESWEEVCIAHGYLNPKPTLYKLIGRTWKDSAAILQEDFGEDFDPEEMRIVRNRITDERMAQHGIPVKAGVESTLTWLRSRHVPSAVASSTRREKVVTYLQGTHLLPHFKTVVGGDQVLRGKPDPEIFLKAASQLKVKPEQCVVFEDSFNGVLAAHAANMRVVMIPDLLPATEEILRYVHHQLQSLEEAMPLLGRMFMTK